jgi:aspartate kinase
MKHPKKQSEGKAAKPRLRLMKFGGTSVGDASAIARVAEIVQAAGREGHVLVVVSALSGVTNKLIEAGAQSAAGKREPDAVRLVAASFENLRQRHHAVVEALIGAGARRKRIAGEMENLFQEGERLCQSVIRLGEMTPAARDAISSLGERLSAPLVAAVLAESGVASRAIAATELIQTDACHGAAEPIMERTRERCEARLRPLLRRGVVPVVTGFIGATAEGALTTLGRGGSDYSATILGAALDADEVTIWTDVDGMMTADPRIVPEARTIPEISYHEAAELAHFGARVLHPKTLSPVTESGIPLWIRNTFAPEREGTRITPRGSSPSVPGPASDGGVKGLAATGDAVLITLSPGLDRAKLLSRMPAVTAALRANIWLIAEALPETATKKSSGKRDGVYLAVSSADAEHAVAALRAAFAPELGEQRLGQQGLGEQGMGQQRLEQIKLEPEVAIVSVVGANLAACGTAARVLAALGRENLDILAIDQSSPHRVSFVLAKPSLTTALAITHREFRLEVAPSRAFPVQGVEMEPAPWDYDAEPRTANAD